MREPPDPDEPGANFDDWFGFALNIGLKLAEQVGLGLRLFNALRERFEGVSGTYLGMVAGTIGQAIRAATGLTGAALNEALVLDDLPIVPMGWNPGEPVDRVIAGVDVTWTDPRTGVTKTWLQWVNSLGFQTPAELIAEAQRLTMAKVHEYDANVLAKLDEDIAFLKFLAKRF